MKALNHLRTINRHKRLVRKSCFKMGLYRQGLLHDMSKYSPAEFLVGCRYYQGVRSPNNAEREIKGCSLAWLHHKGRNKHHFEYWVDYGLNGEGMAPVEMPVRYVAEMLADRIAASKVYLKDKYTPREPLLYFQKGKGRYFMHEKTSRLLQQLLEMLAEEGEDAVFQYVKDKVL